MVVVGDLLQPTHLLFVLVVALLVLGPKRLPEVGRALGRGLRDFRSAISGDELTGHSILSSDQSEPASTPPADQPTTTSTAGQEPGGATQAPADHPAPQDHPADAPTEQAETVTASFRSDSTF
jgi:sec-independent protein translocase protein TatA